VAFTPSAGVARAGTLTVTDSNGNAITGNVTGTGAQPVLTVTPPSEMFLDGSTQAGVITVTNSSPASADVPNITLTATFTLTVDPNIANSAIIAPPGVTDVNGQPSRTTCGFANVLHGVITLAPGASCQIEIEYVCGALHATTVFGNVDAAPDPQRVTVAGPNIDVPVTNPNVTVCAVIG